MKERKVKMTNFEKKLNKLPQEKIADLELITDKIIETGLAEIIILYGSHARGDFKDGRIVEIEGTNVLRRSDYDILVVIDQPDEKREIEKFYKGSVSPKKVGSTSIEIRRKLRGLNLSVQVIVEQIGEINKRLKEKQYFYSDIKREGIVLYDTGKCQLSESPEEVTPTIRRQYAEDHFEGWFKEAGEFWKTYKFNYQEKMYRKAAFMLEQACEMCYKCILLVYTHYSPSEHDLYKLREEAEKCEPLLQTVFPLEPDKQEDLFSKLNLAYIGARYIKNFTVEPDEIDYWKPEVEKLLSLTEQTCKIKIEALKQIEIELQS